MKKIISTILLLVLCLTLCASVFVGCTDDTGDGNKDDKPSEDTTDPSGENKKDNVYSLTLVDNENNPIANATVMITNGTSIFKNGITDVNGKFSVEVEGEGLGVMIVNLPDGYEKPSAVSGTLHALFGDKKEVTVIATKKTEVKVTYKVTVVDQDGNAVVGAHLQLCPNGTCLSDDFVTDATGAITKDMSPDLPVDVKIKSLPDGYSMPEELENGYHAKINAGETEITVTVTKNA